MRKRFSVTCLPASFLVSKIEGGIGISGIPCVAQMVKNPPTMQETWVQSLSREDPLEGMTTHSSILAWRIPWTEEPGGQQSIASQTVEHD